MLGNLYTIEEDPTYEHRPPQIQSSGPSLLGCFGGIDVTVEQSSMHEQNVGLSNSTSYGQLKQPRKRSPQDRGSRKRAKDASQEVSAIFSTAGESKRLLMAEDCGDEESSTAQKRSKASCSMRTRMGVMKSKLKSSTWSVAAKLKKACEHMVEVAHKSVSPHMVDLFLNNHLLAQLSAVPVVRPSPPPPPLHFPCYQRTSSRSLCSCSPPPPPHQYYSYPF